MHPHIRKKDVKQNMGSNCWQKVYLVPPLPSHADIWIIISKKFHTCPTCREKYENWHGFSWHWLVGSYGTSSKFRMGWSCQVFDRVKWRGNFKSYVHCNYSSLFVSCWHRFNQHHIYLHSFGILWTFEQKAIKAEMRGQMKSLYFIVIVFNWCTIITLIIEPKSGLENRFPFSSDKIKLILAFIWFRLAGPVSFRRPCKRW